MTPRYLISEIQKSLLATIAAADTGAADFYVRPPLVIDGTAEGVAFRSMVDEDRRNWLARDFAAGRLRYVSQLRGGAYLFAREKIKAHYGALDKSALAEVSAFLEAWRTELKRAPGQRSKSDGDDRGWGILIALPHERIRLSYDMPSLSGL